MSLYLMYSDITHHENARDTISTQSPTTTTTASRCVLRPSPLPRSFKDLGAKTAVYNGRPFQHSYT